jgi:hypothetical protein
MRSSLLNGDPSLRGLVPNPSGPGAVPPTIAAPEATMTAGSSAIPADVTKKSKSRLVFAIVGALVVAGGVAGLVVAKSSSRATVVTTNTTQTSVAPVADHASDAHVHVALQSSPDGAEVFEGDRSLGHTPLTLDWQGAEGDPARSHTFVFRLAGHHDATVTLTGATLEHTATLEAEAEAPSVADAGATAGAATPTRTVRSTRTTRTTRNTAHPNGTPSGYRGIDDW